MAGREDSWTVAAVCSQAGRAAITVRLPEGNHGGNTEKVPVKMWVQRAQDKCFVSEQGNMPR